MPLHPLFIMLLFFCHFCGRSQFLVDAIQLREGITAHLCGVLLLHDRGCWRRLLLLCLFVGCSLVLSSCDLLSDCFLGGAIFGFIGFCFVVFRNLRSFLLLDFAWEHDLSVSGRSAWLNILTFVKPPLNLFFTHLSYILKSLFLFNLNRIWPIEQEGNNDWLHQVRPS